VAVSRASHGVTMEAGPAPGVDQDRWRDWLTTPETGP
jgi:hypothetical protein